MDVLKRLGKKLGVGLLALMLNNVAIADAITYFHNDISGSPMAATDAAGNLLWKENYKPYGDKLKRSVPSSGNKIGYHGKAHDDSTGLSYMGARYYDPVLGRFMGIDAVDFQEDNLHSFNRYTFANNNPYKYVDPDGNYAFLITPLMALITALSASAILSSTNNGSNFAGSGGFNVGGISYPGSDTGNPSKWSTVNNSSEESNTSKQPSKDTLKPGEFAGDSIPARGPGRDFTQDERDAINSTGRDTGCHTCGKTDPGTKSGNYIPDHQPANALNPTGGEQRLYPHCLGCSRVQGGQVRGATRYNQ